MKHRVDVVNRVGMGGGAGCFEAPALVDGDVHHHAARLHQLDHLAPHQLRSGRPGNEHRANHQIGQSQRLANCMNIRRQCDNAAVVNVVQLPETVQVPINNRDVRSKPASNFRGVMPNNASTQYHDVGGRGPGNASKQNAPSAIGGLQVLRADLHRHPARHFAHRCQQWQRAVLLADRFVGDGIGSRIQQRLRKLGQRREVQIGKEDKVPAKERVLGGLRLLHFNHEIGLRPDCGGRRENTRACLGVLRIGNRTAPSGPGFDDDLMPGLDEGVYSGGDQPHAGLMVLHLFGRADDHYGTGGGETLAMSGLRLGPRPSAISDSDVILPVGGRLCSSWNRFNAATVAASQLPFGVVCKYPRLIRACWIWVKRSCVGVCWPR